MPWPPGPATDLVGRTLAQARTGRLGQPRVSENKTGAGGSIGTILERLAQELEAASATGDAGAAGAGVEPSPPGPAAFRTMLAEQRAVFEPVLRQLGIRAE
ncbi:MAG: hypothetical protein JWO26_804 [Rhodospirillales bacterium]|nr:hypothetical protein [Rhodospirillales bacterium]